MIGYTHNRLGVPALAHEWLLGFWQSLQLVWTVYLGVSRSHVMPVN